MALVEREEHLGLLDRALAACRARTGGVVLMNAPAACGRSALLHELAGRAEAAGMVTISAECAGGEHELVLGALTQLAQHPALRRPDPAATTGTDLLRVVHDACADLLRLAASRPVLVTVDDIRHADEASLGFLLHLARRAFAAPLLVVLTDDDTDPEPRHVTFRAELSRMPGLRRVRLGPLSPAGVRAVLTARGDPAEPRAAELWRASGGNPLLVRALADDQDAGAGRHEVYRLALHSLLHRLPRTATRVLHGLAVLDDADPAELAVMTGAGEDLVGRSLRALNAAGLLDDGRLRHPGARDAVLADVAPADRRDLHRAAAHLVRRRGGGVAEVAEHLLRAGGDDAPWAADVLIDAAAEALHDGRTPDALDALRLARQAPGVRPERIRMLLAEAEWQADPSAAAEHLDALVTDASTGVLDTGEQAVVVNRLLAAGRAPQARQLLDRMRAADSAGVRDLDSWLAAAHPRLARRRPGAPDTFAVRAGADPWLHKAARLADALLTGPGPGSARVAEEALAGLRLNARRPWAAEAAGLALLILSTADHSDPAERWGLRLLAEAQARQSASWQAMFGAAMAHIVLQRGDLTRAGDFGRTALAGLSAASWGAAIGFPLAAVILAATRRGDHDEAAKYLDQALPSGTLDSRYGLHYLHARGHHYLSTGHHYPALADFMSCGELVRGWGLDAADLVPWRTDAAQAWLRLGNPEQARQLVYEQAGRADATARTRARHLRALAATSPVARRPEMLGEALELFERCGDRFGQAEVLADLCAAHHETGDRHRARMVFRKAWHLADVLNAVPLAQRLMSWDGAVPLPAAETETAGLLTSLTPSERRVASLAVLGCTNREIATRLDVTASTVEQHLTRVYRKLGVRRRRDLPLALDASA
ncbi:AAA family ATPase [Actinoplanes sp. DH11]|uniref:AAA family ATPase n=1 Tax=Actinoplanes sp. DH11 TaxID=2857011 RepID=UPI001E367A72|nr:LuxR family transcriptional regulator [Actinoplanes sp. DH11]